MPCTMSLSLVSLVLNGQETDYVSVKQKDDEKLVAYFSYLKALTILRTIYSTSISGQHLCQLVSFKGYTYISVERMYFFYTTIQ